MVKIIWTEVAIEDLRSIHSYISRDSKYYADKFVEKLISRIDQLESYPASGRVVPEFQNDSIRELIEGSYRMIYKMEPEFVAIVRVHHSAKQLKDG